MSTDIGVRLNGSVTDNFELSSGQAYLICGQTAPTTTPITQIDVVTTADPASLEQIIYWVMGD
jgi:hypothetical protein